LIKTQVINDVNKTLYKILRESFGDDEHDAQIIFGSPAEENLADTTKAGIYVFLYFIVEDSFSRNEPNQITVGSSSSGGLLSTRPPLAINLSYMLTPFSASVEGKDSLENVRSHNLIAKAMRAFYDNGLINSKYFPPDTILGQSQIRITPTHMTFEEITKIWSTFSKPFQLSVCYEISTAFIYSDENTKEISLTAKPPILETTPVFNDKAMETLKSKGGISIKISPNSDRSIQISNIVPSLVQPGLSISIYGKDFRSKKKLTVKIDDKVIDSNNVAVINENQIKIRIPSDIAPGEKKVYLKFIATEEEEEEGGGHNDDDSDEEMFATFNVLPVEPNPIKISDIRPIQGIIGDIITVFGINFTKDCKINIGPNIVSKTTFVDSSQINFVIPDGLGMGIINLTVKKSDLDLDTKQFRIVSS